MNTDSNVLKHKKGRRSAVAASLAICASLLVSAVPAQAGKHSLVIALDGLRGDGIENASTPNMDKLINGTWAPGYKGAFAHYAQTMTDAAPNSGPNHVGIMTGVTATKSRVTNNGNVAEGDYETYPHYLTLIKNHNATLNTAYLVTWGTDMQIANSADLKIDSTDAGNTENAVKIMNGTFASSDWPMGTSPDAVFLFLDDIDAAGHACCFNINDTGYTDEITEVDGQVGRILEAIKNRPNFASEDWQIVITSDHGGRGSSHGIHAADNYTIPFLVASKDVNQGYLQGVPKNYDAAPTALAFMGVTVPTNIDGVVQGSNVMPEVPAELKQDLITYIPFEGDYKDASGHDRHAHVGAGSPEIKNGGKFGRFIAIDGNQEYVTLGSPAAMDFGTSRDFTLFTWYRVSGDQNGDPVIVGNKDWNSGSNRGVLLLANEGNGDDFGINIASSGADRKDFDPVDYSFNGWWLLVATFDRDGAATLYAGSPQGKLHSISGEIKDVGDITTTLNWNIGQDGTGSYSKNLKADLDDFAVWGRALSLGEIRTLFGRGEGVELNYLFNGVQSKYLNAGFEFVAGQEYRVLITGRANSATCGLEWDATIESGERNAKWDCSGGADPMILKVGTVSTDQQGGKSVSGTLVAWNNKGGLEWDGSIDNEQERNAKFDENSSGDPISVRFVTDFNDTRIFTQASNDQCGLQWNSSIVENERNAKWDCSPTSDPLRFELIESIDPVDPGNPDNGPATLIAHFPLDGSTHDASGNGHVGSPSGTITYVKNTTRHYADFNNSGMIAIAVGTNLPDSLPTEAITVSSWVYTRSADSWGGFTGIFQDNGSFEKGWLLGSRSRYFSFALSSKDGNGLTYMRDDSPFNLNQWYHLAATYDGTTMKLYVDGVLKATATSQNGKIVMPPSGWWQIGSYKDDNEDFRHDGGLHDVKLFDKALNAAAIQQLMQLTPPAPTVLAGDLDNDGDVDRDDVMLLRRSLNQPALGENDPKDIDSDGVISALDLRKLIALCTRTRCATN